MRSRPAAGALTLAGVVLALACFAHRRGEARPGGNAASRPQTQPRTLARTEDHVVLRGAELPKMVGRHKHKVRPYAVKEGALVPMAYQIDERTKDGGWCWDRGDERIEDEDRGVFDDDDELVFMAKDAGDRVEDPLAIAPKDWEVDGWTEIALEDPLDGGKAWVYVLKFTGTPSELSPTTYVGFDRSEEGICRWRGERFMSSNDKTPENACRMTTLKFAPPGSTDPSKGTSVFDCSKVILVAHWTILSFTGNSSDVKIQVGGWLQGPIRVVAQNKAEVRIAWGIWIRAPDSVIALYPNCTTMPTNVSMPVTLNESDPSSYKLMIDLSSRAKGWRFYNSHNPDPVAIDGRMDEKEKKLDPTFPSWNCVYGPEGAVITRFVLDPRAVKPTNKLIYVDDANERLEPEFEEGAFGTNGYYVDMAGMKSGTYSGDYMLWYSAAPFAKGDEKKFLCTVDQPLKRTVR